MRRSVAACVIAPLLGAFVYMLVMHVFISDETRIERQIQKGRKALENEAILSIASLVAEDYRDEYGHDRAELLAGLRSFFQTADELQIDITRIRVSVGKLEAEALVQFTISVVDGQRLDAVGYGGAGTAWLRFSKQAGSWQVIEAAWRDSN